MRELALFPEYRTFRNLDGAEGENDRAPQSEPEVCADKTPEEKLAESYTILRDALSAELLDVIRKASPVFFEKLVVDLLVGMGYGGSVEDAGKAVGGAGDDGIDGIIKEDKLGLDVVYIQAKRWTANVGRQAVQSFVGSLEGHRARKGVLITTSDFSQDAREYVQPIDKKIVLVSGRQLRRPRSLAPYSAPASTAPTRSALMRSRSAAARSNSNLRAASRICSSKSARKRSRSPAVIASTSSSSASSGTVT